VVSLNGLTYRGSVEDVVLLIGGKEVAAEDELISAPRLESS
jgi:hypothetical protein